MKFDLERSIEVLSATPMAVRALLADLSDEWTASNGDRDNWEPYDIIGHYIYAEEANWIPRAKVILAQADDRTFPPFDRYGQFERSDQEPLAVRLDEFGRIRAENIEILRSWELVDEELELKGVHPQFGEVSLRELIATWVVHDLTHIRQLATVMAKRHDEAVGPWKAYLSILN
ncbi:MAG: DinB family protein [Pyrinomonadaceae bacterium]